MVTTNAIPVNACKAFGNANGRLVCDAEPNAPDIPSGSYQDSCGGCQLVLDDNQDGTPVLSCTACTNSKGDVSASTLSLGEEGSCQKIGNDDGNLVCEDEEEDTTSRNTKVREVVVGVEGDADDSLEAPSGVESSGETSVTDEL